MTKDQPWCLEVRAENLAIIALTENSDVEVLRESRLASGTMLDILAQLRENGKPSGRFFGVEVKAALASQKPSGAVSLSQHERSFFHEVPFPVCLFFSPWTTIRDTGLGSRSRWSILFEARFFNGMTILI